MFCHAVRPRGSATRLVGADSTPAEILNLLPGTRTHQSASEWWQILALDTPTIVGITLIAQNTSFNSSVTDRTSLFTGRTMHPCNTALITHVVPRIRPIRLEGPKMLTTRGFTGRSGHRGSVSVRFTAVNNETREIKLKHFILDATQTKVDCI